MFEKVLLEENRSIQSRRPSATLVSFILQAVIVATIAVVPLLITQALPMRELTTMLIAPPPPPPPAPPAARTAAPKVAEVKVTPQTLNTLRAPTKIPKKVDMTPQVAAANPTPPAVGGVVGGVPGGVQGGTVGGVLGGVLSSASSVPPKPNLVRVSQGVTEGLLVHKVTPQYPPAAKQARVQGTVVLKAIIGKDGRVENIQPEQGSPMLVAAAVNAVKQWRYRPYVLNGNPVNVETTVRVDFHLNA